VADFIERLKQRKIVQWALAYIAASFALIQVIDIVAQRFGWPAQTIRVVILALAVGFCIVLVLAWYHGERGAQRVTGVELLILALFLAVGGRMIWNLAGESDSAPSHASADTKSIDLKSIAVLPFESLSDDKENAYFADGIQDEILTRLAKIGELRVISRTSTQQYSAKTRNLRDIGRELGVGMVLEGSVRRVDKVVRVTVQLISAASDEHVWAESYDRTLDDVLGVESDIAQAVASALHAKLSGSQAAVVAARPTTNADAYDVYLRALAVETHAAGLAYDRHHVASLYEDAVRQDPTFALAWAHLAIARSNMFFSFYDRSSDDAAAVKAAAKAAVDKALALDPTLGEAYLALGFYRYRCLHDFAGGLTAFEQARQRLPNNAEVLASISFIERRQGRWRDSLEHLQAAT
jgi:TolB-like protein